MYYSLEVTCTTLMSSHSVSQDNFISLNDDNIRNSQWWCSFQVGQ